MPSDYEPVKRLMALVMERLDATGPTDLVVKLGLTATVPNAPRLAMNWIAGVNAPRTDYLMLMLSKAGLLTSDAEAAWWGQADPAAAARDATELAREAEERLSQSAKRARPRRGRATG